MNLTNRTLILILYFSALISIITIIFLEKNYIYLNYYQTFLLFIVSFLPGFLFSLITSKLLTKCLKK